VAALIELKAKTLNGDDVKSEDDDKGVRELHVWLIGLVVLVLVGLCLGSCLRAQRFGGGRTPRNPPEGHFQDFFHRCCDLVDSCSWLFESVYGVLEAIAALAVVAKHVEGGCSR
jgi:hypothetical protein